MENQINSATVAQTKKTMLGVWHRPNPRETERDLGEVCHLLDRFSRAGITAVFLESFFHGMTIFKTDRVPYYRGFEGRTYGEYPDYLTAFVTEAGKRGIDVHAWVQDFYVGCNDDEQIMLDHPDWLLRTQSGDIRHKTEGAGFGGYIFLDPANPEVRSFLVGLYDEMLTHVPAIRGLNLDYIRYPISDINESTDSGYTEVSMDIFARRHGLTLDPENKRESLVRIINERGLLPEWVAHRAYFITDFVKSVRSMLLENHPGKLISTAVFPEPDISYMLKKQAISVWLDKGYLDFVTPMVYFFESDKVYSAVAGIKSRCKDALCYSGLYTTYHSQSTDELAAHIDASLRAGADGVILFDSAKTFTEAKVNYEDFLARRAGN